VLIFVFFIVAGI